MPWTTDDYPDSLKNLDTAVRKKAIEIANALVEEGYKDGEAIPIATKQAKEWKENASEEEISSMKQKSNKELKDHDTEDSSRSELLDEDVIVESHDDGWAVRTKKAKRPSQVYDKKDEAIKRGLEIIANKETTLIIYKKDGTIQEKRSS